MPTLYEALGVDDTAGIEKTEIAQIKKLLDRVKVAAAQVARTHDTEETIAFLTFVRTTVARLARLDDSEWDQFMAQVHAGTASPAAIGGGGGAPALGTGGPPSAPPAPVTLTSDDALRILTSDSRIDQGRREAARRLFTRGGDQIHVLPDGTPEATSRNEQSAMRFERLATERDELLRAALEGAGLTPVAGESTDALKARVAAKVSGPDSDELKAMIDKIIEALETGHTSRINPADMVIKTSTVEQAKATAGEIKGKL